MNQIVNALVGAAILGAVGWATKAYRDRRDSATIYKFLVNLKSDTNWVFRSTQAIASHTSLSESRVESLCAIHPKIRRNEKNYQSWTLVEFEIDSLVQ